ncbi:MAG TPA: TonB-dependent receptor [Longimicrobiales bacterium]|nr:TonB-dependent receptor [Longimicrobiales bacterium]
MKFFAPIGAVPGVAAVLAVALSTTALLPSHLHAAQDPVSLDTIVVTASTPVARPLGDLGNHVTVLEGDRLRARGITRVEDALREASGLSVVRGGSWGAVTSLFLRGAESDQVQVLLDGVPINQPGGSIDLAGLTVENIERIEVARGPSSSLNGSDALAGVIQIVTRRGRGPAQGSVFARGGSFGRRDVGVSASGSTEAAAFSLSATRYRTDGILEFNNEHLNTVFTGRVDLRPDERTTLRLSGTLSDREYQFPTDGAGNVVDINNFTFQDRTSLSLLATRELSDGVGLRLLISSSDEETGTDDQFDDPADTNAFTSLAAFRRLGVDLRSEIEISEGSSFVVGGEFEEQDVRDFSEFVSSFGTSVGRSENARRNLAGYLHWVGTLGGLELGLGGRLEDNEYYGTFETWNAGVSWRASDLLRLRASAGRGIKEPTFPELFSTGFTIGNPDLDPERSTSWEAGLDLARAGWALGATWFDQDIEELIQYTGSPPNPADPNFFNVAGATSRGLELDGSTHLGPVELNGAWTWVETEVVDAGFASGVGATFVEGEPLIRRPEHTIRLGAAAQAGAGLRFSTSVERVGERADRDFSTFPATPVTLDPYTLLDATVSCALAPGSSAPLALTLRGENLLDQDYEGAFGFRAPGRVLTLEVRASFGG